MKKHWIFLEGNYETSREVISSMNMCLDMFSKDKLSKDVLDDILEIKKAILQGKEEGLFNDGHPLHRGISNLMNNINRRGI